MNSKRKTRNTRNGNVAVLSVFMMTALLSLIAFSVNLGRLSNSMAKLQNSSDATGRGAAWKLMQRFGKADATLQATAEAQNIVRSTMGNRGIDHTLLPESDLKFGTYSWDPVTRNFKSTWGTSPANLVQAKLSRVDVRGNALDVVLRKFLGRDTVELKTLSNVVFMPATGFVSPTGNQTIEILPFTLDIDTWIALENGVGTDEFTVNPNTNTVTPGGDGVLEVKIFPIGPNKNLPSGNRGTLRLGANNNSTSKLSRQIRFGLNASDMSYHPNGLSVANGPLNLPGDPGVSAAIENDLLAILGQDRILPIFTTVTGNGANASYSIVKFVGVKVVKADLRGALNHKAVVLQPSDFAVEEATTNMKMPLNQTGTIFVKPTFINLE